MQNKIIVSHLQGNSIVLFHDESDPGVWIVRRFKKIMGFNKTISSNWFNSERQALTFADELKLKSEERTIKSTKESRQ